MQIQAVAARAATYDPVRAVLAVLAVPFYVLGIVLCVLWLAGTWLFAAVVAGIDDARARAVDGET